MNLLAVETSGRAGSIALLQDGEEPIERSLNAGGRRHAQTLVADADALLAEAGLGPRHTDGIAVSLGPGSFTGLRVGIVFAKTFGWINRCPVVAVPTFRVVAEQAPPTADHICVVGDAQRGELFLAEFTRRGGSLRQEHEIEILSAAEAHARLKPDSVLIGPGLTRFAPEFERTARLAMPDVWQPRAATLARLGKLAFDNGDIADPWQLEPLYVRRSAAEEKRDAGPAGRDQ